MKVTFAHGLWSSTDSSKAEWMRAQGWDVLTLDMRKYGWDQAAQTRVVLEAIDEHGPFDVLIGSSFGGLATANAAAQRPDANLRLVLLAPAFGYDELVAKTLGDAGMKAWEENSNSKDITMIADGNGQLAVALDLVMDGSAFSLGKRCQRFAMIIQNGEITTINTEDGPGLDKSSAESILQLI